MNKFSLTEVNQKGIICDNPNCDFHDSSATLQTFDQWLNKPCPKCGENLLTPEDMERAIKLRETVNFINSLSEEQAEMIEKALGLDKIEITEEAANTKFVIAVQTHNEFKIEVKPLK
jgi:hypothetical protein